MLTVAAAKGSSDQAWCWMGRAGQRDAAASTPPWDRYLLHTDTLKVLRVLLDALRGNSEWLLT